MTKTDQESVDENTLDCKLVRRLKVSQTKKGSGNYKVNDKV